MPKISHTASHDALDVTKIEQGIARGRRLQAEALRSAFKGLFSRRAESEVRRKNAGLPDGAATA